MLTGVVNVDANGPRLRTEEVGVPTFDPRPWPLVVLILLGLWGVYAALMSGSEEGGTRAPVAPAATTRAVEGVGVVGREQIAEPQATAGRQGELSGEVSGEARVAAGKVEPAELGEEKERFEQGVTLVFEQGQLRDVRSARVLALRVPEGTAASPVLERGAFKATWSGFLNLRLRGEYTFSVLGRGKVLMRVGGKVVLEAEGEDFDGKASGAVKMNKGRNPIEVVYESPGNGDAWVRVLWESREFPAEAVQPGVLVHDVSEKGLREGERVREGRELVANLRCGNCHAMGVKAGDGVMAELGADAPDLSDAGARLKQGWMAAWISDPRSLRPDASMPRVFHAAEGATAAEAGDVAAYLATLGRPDGKTVEANDAMVKEGGQLFAGLGCVGCHTKPDVEEIDKERGRVPLKFVNAKFQAGALKRWLMNPREHYAWARMPDFRLTEFEADRLVAYLTSTAKGEIAGEVKGDAGRGKALFASAGCVNCHKMKDGAAAVAARAMEELVARSDWAKGCLATDEAGRGRAPDFGLSDSQREAIRAVVSKGVKGMTRDVGPEFAERAVRRFQCLACHGRDEVEDRWSTLADEVSEMAPEETNIESDEREAEGGKGARLFVQRGLGKVHGGDRLLVAGDQSRPGLTWAGEKLRPAWMGRFIAGEIGYKPRYWMRARMPAFHGVVAKGIAEGLALEHGMPTVSEGPAKSDAGLAEVGRKLVGRDGGLACVTCHSVVETRAASPFEAPAPNLMHVSERLTHDYYVRWMRKPMRFWPGTKMPQFSEEGRSALKEVLGGEADRQFEAIWQYVLRGEGMGAPE